MKEKSSAPTMKDVAELAGVSLGTVSNVVRGLPVGEAYRAKVEDAIQALNYQVNSYAQGMKAERTNTVAVLIPTLVIPFFASLVNEIYMALSRRSYRMLLYCTDYDLKQEQEYINLARQNRVDGIIGLTYSPGLSTGDNLRYVSIDRCLRPSIPCVSSDNFQGGKMAAEQLSRLGCKNVAFFRVGSVLENEPNKRKAGFEDGCHACGLSYDMNILEDGDDPEEWFRFLKDHYHDGKLDYDGIFCVTDLVAHEIIGFLKRLSLRVPDDVQVIGFDGVRRFGTQELECSTIVQPVSDIAEMSVQLLLQDESSLRPPLVCLPVTYAPGGTTKEPVE